jgi:hypothetical protein
MDSVAAVSGANRAGKRLLASSGTRSPGSSMVRASVPSFRFRLAGHWSRRQTASSDTDAFKSSSPVNSGTLSVTTSHGLAGNGVLLIMTGGI